MDISGLSSITTATEMATWLTENCVTPIRPAMSGEDFGAIIQKVIEVAGGASDISAYLKSLPGYVGDGSKLLGDDLTWHGNGETTLTTPVLSLGDSSSNNIPASWTTVVNANVYMLQRALDNLFTNALTNVYNGSGVSFDDIGLAFGTQYFYRVKATAPGFNDSPWSTVQSKTTGSESGQTANVNLGNTGYTASEPGWVNFILADWSTSENGWNSGTSPEIDNNAGAPTGWKINFSAISGIGSGPVTMQGISAPDFPDDVTNYRWINLEQTAFYPLTMVISGLNPGSIYNITTVHFDPASLIIDMKWGNVDNSGDQGANGGTTPLELIAYTVVPDSDGNVTGHLLSDDTGSAVINGIIITEVPILNKAANIELGQESDFDLLGWTIIPNSPLDTAYALSAINQVALGWNVTVSSNGTLVFENITSDVPSADFPPEIRRHQWYVDSGNSMTFTFSGLDITKSYTIKTCHADSGYTGNGTTVVTCNGSAAQSGDPDNTTFFLTFVNILPDSSGNIVMALTSPDGAPIINAIIVLEQ